MSKLKAPPQFNPGEDNYEEFKKELRIWDSFTDLDKKKRGPAVYLSLDKKSKQAVSQLTPENLSEEDGLQQIIQKLDDVYLADKTTRAYAAFQKFYKCRRDSGETFEAFLVRFEDLNNGMAEYEMSLPDAIKAFFLLNAANLAEETEQLARATSELTYRSMLTQIKKICGSSYSGKEDEKAPPIKDEVFYGYDKKKKPFGRGRNKSGQERERKGTDNQERQKSGSERDRKRSDNYERYKKPTERKRADEGNSKNVYGIQKRCFICDSQKHMSHDCPMNKKNDKGVEEINILLFSETVTERQNRFIEDIIVLLNGTKNGRQLRLVIESLGKAVLDCGCTKTVAGEFWISEYLSTLSKEDEKLVFEEPSTSLFRFGDGGECKGLRKIYVPVVLGKKKSLLPVEVVKADIPLLLSKETMKSLKMKVDFEEDKAIINEHTIKLSCTSTGHYCLPLNYFDVDAINIVLKVIDMESLKKSEKMTKAKKLHKQFGHATEEKLTKLAKSSGIKDKEFFRCISKVCNECEACEKYRKAPLKPAVSLPLADTFNKVVCLDLKEFKHNKVWILHLIDAATRYSAARLITTKDKDVVMNEIFNMWIGYFGKPKKFMSDNGGEFNNKVYSEAAEKLGVEITMPPAHSPFSNGIVERHNKILYETMMKTMEDTKCKPSLALSWACSAKNALQNQDGFSPNILVFGRNVNVPSVLDEELPALTGNTSSDVVRKNLQALHSARENYVKAENSNRIRRALSHKTRTYGDEIYQSGDKVYFRRGNEKNWKGPANVLGFDGYTVLLKQGGSVYKCHRSNVLKIKSIVKRQASELDKNVTFGSGHNRLAEARNMGKDTESSESEHSSEDEESESSEEEDSSEEYTREEESDEDTSEEDFEDEISEGSNHDDSYEEEVSVEEISEDDACEGQINESYSEDEDRYLPSDENQEEFESESCDDQEIASATNKNGYGPDVKPKVNQ